MDTLLALLTFALGFAVGNGISMAVRWLRQSRRPKDTSLLVRRPIDARILRKLGETDDWTSIDRIGAWSGSYHMIVLDRLEKGGLIESHGGGLGHEQPRYRVTAAGRKALR